MNYEKYLIAAGVPQELHQQALEYPAKCEQDYRAARIAWHKATAWIVVGWLLLRGKVPFEAEALPERWKAYDNDVSINGDRGVWLWADNQEGTYAELQPCPLDDSALQYSYFGKHHPRSKWHRWLWLGTRNMASRLASDVGPEITPEIHSVEPWYFGLVIRRNVGVKLSMAVPGLRRRAPLVLIKFSLISGK